MLARVPLQHLFSALPTASHRLESFSLFPTPASQRSESQIEILDIHYTSLSAILLWIWGVFQEKSVGLLPELAEKRPLIPIIQNERDSPRGLFRSK